MLLALKLPLQAKKIIPTPSRLTRKYSATKLHALPSFLPFPLCSRLLGTRITSMSNYGHILSSFSNIELKSTSCTQSYH